MRLYERRIIALGVQMGLHRDDALDACQDAFVKVFRYIRRFRSGHSFYSSNLSVVSTQIQVPGHLPDRSRQMILFDQLVHHQRLKPRLLPVYSLQPRLGYWLRASLKKLLFAYLSYHHLLLFIRHRLSSELRERRDT